MKSFDYLTENTCNLVLKKWQKSIDLLAELMYVPAALIMRYENECMEVFVSSKSTGNPYKKGDKEKWSGLYCQTVLTSQEKLLIPNALNDEKWNKNPDIKLGMISYLGFPINYADNMPFGTICVLDNKEKNYTKTHERLLLHFKEIIEQDLLIIQSLDSCTNKKLKNYAHLLNESISFNKHNKVYRRLFESASAAILILSADFIFIDCNNMASKLLERSREEILGTTPVDLSFTPEYQPNGRLSAEMGGEYFASAMQGDDVEFEWVHLKKNGTDILVAVSLFGFFASNKKNFFVMWKDLTDTRRKEIELKESEERFRSIFAESADGQLILEPFGSFITCNDTAVRQLKYNSKDEIIGKNPVEISPEFQLDGSKSIAKTSIMINNCLNNGQHRFEWIHQQKDGEPIFFDIVLTKIIEKGNYFIHCLWRDITEKKNAEELLKSALDENTILLRELYHRTKNNMQVISSMLNLKSAFSNNPEVKTQLLECANKIQTMSLVHKKLYKSKNLSRLSIKEYVFDLVELMTKSYIIDRNRIKIDLVVEDFSVLIDIAIPIGLILNELLLNILKHAFPDGHGLIKISVNKFDENIFIHVEDDGIGVAEGFDFYNTKTLGLQTTIALVQKQLSGKIEFKSEKGLNCDISFADVLYTERI